jgi:hypothetical protein
MVSVAIFFSVYSLEQVKDIQVSPLLDPRKLKSD